MHADCLNQYKPGTIFKDGADFEFIFILGFSDKYTSRELKITVFNCCVIQYNKTVDFEDLSDYYLNTCIKII